MFEDVRPVEAMFENGLLKPANPLNLRPGERVALIVVRQPDPKRWDTERLAAVASDDEELAAVGLEAWSTALEREDHG